MNNPGVLDPHAVEERHPRGRPARQRAEGHAVPISDGPRTIEPPRRQMVHQPDEERQVACLDALLVERQDEPATLGMEDEIGVLDALRDPLAREEAADIVARKEARELVGRDVGVNGHALLDIGEAARR